MTATELLPNRFRRHGLQPPQSLTLMITSGCNLQCHHCLLDCGPPRADSAVPSDALINIIRDFISSGVHKINIAGGEPLTHPEWMRIVDYACCRSEIEQVTLQTNGDLLDEATIRQLTTLTPERFRMQVSIEGASALTHDAVRGSGSFEATFRGIRLAIRQGLGEQTQVAFTEMAHNFHEIPQLLALLDEIGISRLVSGTLVRGGRAATSRQLTAPSTAQACELLDLYHKDRAFRDRYDRIANVSVIEWYKGRSEPADRLCSCIENPFISAAGRLYPCVMLLSEKYAVASVFHRSFEDIISEGLPIWAELPQISRRRMAQLETCEGCSGRLHCGGGCMGRAFAHSGVLMAPEDRCALRKAAYCWKPDGSIDPNVRASEGDCKGS
ncbi:MAG: radical SAM protein [Desulfobacterales bacterium]|jgi:radical SAM protein with 4Fe4S-binding SPASM domain